MVRKVPIIFKREKGPPTPNFGIVAHLLASDKTTTIPFDKERVGDQHGGVGIKMSFVCDLLECIESLDKRPDKVFVSDSTWGINAGVFQELLRTVDVFLFELYSILDYSALELSEIYGLRCRTQQGRLKKVQSFMELKRAENLCPHIRRAVDELVGQLWFHYFHRLRVRVTHTMPVDFPGLLANKDGKISRFEYPFLPDDPDKVTLTCQQKRPLVEEFKKWVDGIFVFINEISGELITLFNTSSP
jgi:hypothetical protein